MNNQDLHNRFSDLSTPLIADACLRLNIPLRIAPAGIHPLIPGSHMAGRVLTAKHYGSVNIFLEVMGMAQPGDILVIDNGGRTDEGCIGDLTIWKPGLVTWQASLSGAVIVIQRNFCRSAFPCSAMDRGPQVRNASISAKMMRSRKSMSVNSRRQAKISFLRMQMESYLCPHNKWMRS